MASLAPQFKWLEKSSQNQDDRIMRQWMYYLEIVKAFFVGVGPFNFRAVLLVAVAGAPGSSVRSSSSFSPFVGAILSLSSWCGPSFGPALLVAIAGATESSVRTR